MGINNIQEGRVKNRPPSHSAANSQLSLLNFQLLQVLHAILFFRPFGRVPGAEVTCQVSGDATHT